MSFLRRKWGKPMIAFGEPECKHEVFGYVWYVPVANTRLAGLRGVCAQRRDILRCRIHGSFFIDDRLAVEHDWVEGYGITLPATGEPYSLPLAVKKQGYDDCGITAVAVGASEHLPANSSIKASLCVIEGEQTLACCDYLIKNYGSNLTDLKVTRLEA